VMATLLLEQASREISAGLGYRKLLVAHAYLHRLLAAAPVPAPPALEALDQLADGGHVAEELAQAAYDAISRCFGVA
jgi:acyl-CoA dehydrogenase